MSSGVCLRRGVDKRAMKKVVSADLESGIVGENLSLTTGRVGAD
jgi:hypothetical protein